MHRSRDYAVTGSNIWCEKLLIELSSKRYIKPDYLFQILAHAYHITLQYKEKWQTELAYEKGQRTNLEFQQA
jgi:hypothetical protein